MTQISNSRGLCPFRSRAQQTAATQAPSVASKVSAQPTMQRGTALVPTDTGITHHDVRSIPCPALAALHARGLLPGTDGQVSTAILDHALKHLGLTPTVRNVLVRAADGTTDARGSFGLFTLNGSNLDHTGSTSIRQDGVHPEAFANLAQFANEHGEFGSKELARAARFFAERDPGIKGTIVQTIEFAALLEVFGRHGDKGPYVTIDDARALFVESRFPRDWQPKEEGSVGFAKVIGRVALMAWHRLFS